MHVFVLPVLVFLAIAGVGLIRLVIFARRFHINVRPGEEGAALHVETPFGNLDLEPRQRLDARFASFVFYPRAQPQMDGSPEYLASGGPAGHRWRSMTATYWTREGSGTVLDFYRNQLPRWTRTREWLGGAEHAWIFRAPLTQLTRFASGPNTRANLAARRSNSRSSLPRRRHPLISDLMPPFLCPWLRGLPQRARPAPAPRSPLSAPARADRCPTFQQSGPALCRSKR